MGLRVYGEGEWKVRRYSYSKHRKWLKLHISVDKDGEIRAEKLTDNDVPDSEAGVELLQQQSREKIEGFIGDGGYDERKMYVQCNKQGIVKIRIPPQKNAKIWVHGNTKGEKHPRDENLRSIRKKGRKRWKEHSGYYQRERAENTIYRIKTIFGDKIQARETKNQEIEATLMIKALNMMTACMPQSYPVP